MHAKHASSNDGLPVPHCRVRCEWEQKKQTDPGKIVIDENKYSANTLDMEAAARLDGLPGKALTCSAALRLSSLTR